METLASLLSSSNRIYLPLDLALLPIAEKLRVTDVLRRRKSWVS